MSENRERMARWCGIPVYMARIDPELGYKAILSRDARFDGRLFVGVRTTGIYCRPICPATKPKYEHCSFYPSAAAAQEAGFRPCLRCRPETAPNLGAWNGASNTVSRGLALIADGALDGDEASVENLATRLGVGARHLRRLFKTHLGASPVAVAQTRRVLFARQLIHETQLPMTDVAEAAGFGSLRRFNETFRQLYRRPPGALRHASASVTIGDATETTLRLVYRPPYDWRSFLAFLSARAIDGVELVENNLYRRTIRIDGSLGIITIRHNENAGCLTVSIDCQTIRSWPRIVARIRRLFDLDADIAIVARHLGQDPWLERLVITRPGLRVPGAWDGFEMGVRAILGQQVTVGHARQLAGALITACGPAFPDPRFPGLTRIFPTASEVLATDLSVLRMPTARKRTLLALAQTALDNPALFDACGTLEETVARLRAIPGIGEWTAQYIALRACREPDAFPASDLGLLRAVAQKDGSRPSPARLLEQAESWRPWRAYAAQHLWMHDFDKDKG